MVQFRVAHTRGGAHLVALGERGRLVLPAALRKSLGLRVGDQFVVEIDERSIRLTPRSVLARRDRGAFAEFATRRRSLVDELLDERRAEASREADAQVPPVVLDASALLAYWLDEPGADVVQHAIGEHGALISAPNFAEVLSKLVDTRPDFADALADAGPPVAEESAATVLGLPMAGGAISVEAFGLPDALLSAKLRPSTRQKGLSLGDRACLALALRLSAPALTADSAWSSLSVGVSVVQIRP